jgi:hypothetical protein
MERVLDLACAERFRRIFIEGGRPVRELLIGHLESGTESNSCSEEQSGPRRVTSQREGGG